ncbi:MAG TPA: hypothetical protein VKZ85_16015 [Woeseiaceae bacterium]|nr:hypothetical protein [Woeseiaceae bacterium]
MTELEVLANIAEIIGVITVITGFFFALLQMRQLRQQRRELAAIELFRFFGSPRFAEAYHQILLMPEGMTAREIRTEKPELERAAMLIANTMENIGVMTYQRIVPFMVVNNLIGASTVILWRKLRLWTLALREDLGQPYAFEWFQWLAERLDDHDADGDADPRAAYEAHRDWKPARLTPEL